MQKLFSILYLFVICITLYGQSFYVGKTNNEVVIEKQYITIGYNTQYLIPNYVGERLVYSMTVGTGKREPGFYPEPLLETKYKTRSRQYTNTGYDRGHLAPAADFKWNKHAMYESFSMANVAPQWPTLNRGKWQQLEDRVRKLSKQVDTLYVITGTIVQTKKTISTGIYVPTYFYKAVLGKKGRYYKISCAWIYNNDISLVSKQITINELEKIIKRNLFIKMNNETAESKIMLQ